MKEKILTAVLLLVIHDLYAQNKTSIALDYTTEVQTNFDKKSNWINLLSLSGELPTEKINKRWKNGCFQIEIISINKIVEERIAGDLQTFSNIEEDKLPISPFLLGYTHQWKKISLFGGVRNINQDYFVTPCTSLFTNSSAGIFPTLSINFPLANYPLSGMCLHVEYQPAEQWLFKSSLYNGVAHDLRKNPLCAFAFRPRKDGIFSISELSYAQNKFGKGLCSLGIAFRQIESTCSLYGTIEQTVFNHDKKETGFIIQGGFAPPTKNECSYYFATGGYFAGLLTRQKPYKSGIYINATEVSGIKEQTMEITWQFQISNKVAIQPTFHCIRTGNQTTNIGLVRLIVAMFD